MYRGLMEAGEKRSEEDFSFQFEEAHFITLGLLYEKNARFAGGAFSPILRRVDKFLKEPLRSSYRTREERAARVAEADAILKEIVEKLKRRGIRHPFVKSFVLARCNPLTRARKILPAFDQTLDRLVKALESFDVQKISQEEIARSAVLAIPAPS